MRVTIAVDGVLREIEVRPDLLSPGMGEWQDATEMNLLRAFGAAYKEAVALRAAAAVDDEPDGEPDTSVVGEEDLYADITPVIDPEPVVEPVAEPVAETTPFAAAPVEFAPVTVYAPSEDDAAAFLAPEGEHAATMAPVVTKCSCGHGIGWHPVSLDTGDAGACELVWPIDDHEPEGPASRCSCLRFAPADVPSHDA